MVLKDTGSMVIYTSYSQFWPFYLQEHSLRLARLIHVIGTFLALFAFLKATLGLSIVWLVLAPVFGYGFDWAAHILVEKNRPATFAYPLWSLRGDLQMFVMWINGRLEIELMQHQIYS